MYKYLPFRRSETHIYSYSEALRLYIRLTYYRIAIFCKQINWHHRRHCRTESDTCYGCSIEVIRCYDRLLSNSIQRIVHIQTGTSIEVDTQALINRND